MHALKPRHIGAAAAAAALLALLAGCGGIAAKPVSASGTSSLATRTATSGPVEVGIIPRQLDAAGARFSVELNNHEIDLTGDYARTSTLTVAGKPWGEPRWAGDGPGGHHRSGTLTFAAGGPATGAVELSLGGLPEPVTVRWTLPAR
jgi:hypothetical protein